MTIRTFKSTTLQDASSIPWKGWDDSAHTHTRDEVWGVSIVPWPVYASYEVNGQGIGEPTYYQWQALLDPEFPLPDWIQDITPVEVPSDTTAP
jgi:hypothetical protein